MGTTLTKQISRGGCDHKGKMEIKNTRKIECYSMSLEPSWTGKLPVRGQGFVAFNMVRNTPFSIIIRKPSCREKEISLNIYKKGASLTKLQNGKQEVLASVENAKAGFKEDVYVTYWLSYDRDNMRLKYGQGYMMEETILLEYDFLEGKNSTEVRFIRCSIGDFFNHKDDRIAELFDVQICKEMWSKYKKYIATFNLEEDESSIIATMETILKSHAEIHFNRNPLICNRPSFILDSSRVSLFHLDRGNYTFSSSLRPVVRELYENIKTCELNLNLREHEEEILLSDAIRHSIETEGCLLNIKLKEKATGFGKQPNEKQTYLRITLGKSYGKSPGIPYVLEIWPARHYSPVHNHGNASAVIKVLYGSIHCRIFNKITHTIDGEEEEPQLLQEFDITEGDVTWIDRNWYQTHQLENITDKFCATIQCYGYDELDKHHFPYFQYIDDSSTIGEFLPNTDFSFNQMYKTVLEEYKLSLIN